MELISNIGLFLGIIAALIAMLQFSGIADFRQLFRLDNPFEITSNRDISRLPVPMDKTFIGREKELAQLHQALHDPKQCMVYIHGVGGVGKSALIYRWWMDVRHDKALKEAKVFAWSFYNQGDETRHAQANSSEFFKTALYFFGISKLPRDDVKKAQTLVQCVSEQTSLLILDGIEPLQHPLKMGVDDFSGKVRDMALKAFLTSLNSHGLMESASLVILSSRQPLKELEAWEETAYVTLPLENFAPADGSLLLKKLGVKDTQQLIKVNDDEFRPQGEVVSEEVGGHILSLTLLGQLVINECDKRLALRDQLPPLWKKAASTHAQVREMLDFYRTRYWYDEDDQAGMVFMELLGLFDRPATVKEMDELVDKARYAKPLRQLSDKAWRATRTHLETIGLLLPQAGKVRTQWDCHPLIRDYFGQLFRETAGQDYQQAHEVLFTYYQRLPKKHLPDTLEEMLPLYQAMRHGCLVGKYQQVVYDVYVERILRWEDKAKGTLKYYSLNQLGAYIQELTALTNFFSEGWSQLVHIDLSENDQIWLLSQISFCLMSTGQLKNAIEPRSIGLHMEEAKADWHNASRSAENLTDLFLALGRLTEAEQAAQQVIAYAEKSGKLFEQLTSYARLGRVFHYQNQLTAAKNAFVKAEQLLQQYRPDLPQLYSVYGFYYCTFLLHQATNTNAIKAVLQRGEYELEISLQNNWLLDIALDQLTIARAYDKLGNKEQANTYFDQAVTASRKAGMIMFLPQFLLDRAAFHIQQNNFPEADNDLEEAWDIIERCEMKLYEVDYHLIQCHYCQLKHQRDQAKIHHQQAAHLIDTTGYLLRKQQLEEYGRELA